MKYKSVFVPFGAYLPDQPFVGSSGLESAHQVVYMDGAYQRIPGMTSLTGATPDNAALNNVIWAHDESGTRIYVAVTGTGSRLWEVTPTTGAITERSKGGVAYAAGDWSFLKFGDNVIASNPNAPIQTIAPASAAIDLATSTTKPQGKFLCACRGHVIVANISQPAAKPREFRWAGRFAPTDWEPGSNRSGFGELFSDAGIITGCVGFEDFWLIFTSTGVFRASYIGGDAVWSLQQIGHLHDGMPRGLYRAIVPVGRDAFYISRTGPKCVVNGETVVDIAAGQVRRSMTDFNRCALTDHPDDPQGYIPFGTGTIIAGVADSLRRVLGWSWKWSSGANYRLVTWFYSIDDKVWSTMASQVGMAEGSYGSQMLLSREHGASLVAGAAGPLRGMSSVRTNFAGSSLKLEHFEDDALNAAATLATKLVDAGPSSSALYAVRLRARFTDDGVAPVPSLTITASGWNNLPASSSDTPDVTVTLDSTSNGTDDRGFLFVPGGPLRAAFYQFKVYIGQGGMQSRDLMGLDLLMDPDKSER